MRLFDWHWLAISSLLIAVAATAETRPQYGGTLHVAMRAELTSLDPSDSTQPDSFARRSLTLLMFDTLVTLDESGRARASLAASWQASPGNQRWQFRMHPGVQFDDGTPLTAETAASSLRAANPSWNVLADGESVIVELSGPDPELLAELALPRNAIVKRNSEGKPAGTGPFRIEDWQPGKKLTLAADENCWRGRPFLDAIEIEMGKSFRDQLTSLEIGKTDFIELTPEQAHRTSLQAQLKSSAPMELVALLFTRDATSPEERMLRQALALSVERTSIRSVLLQGAGQPAASILPNWMSGYGFVFPTDFDLPRARQLVQQVHTVPTWTIAYDGSDAVDRLLAERVALNAKDAGLSLQPTSAAGADLRLVRIPLASSDPWVALDGVASVVGLPPAKVKNGSTEELYEAEQMALATERIIPLFHLPVSYGSSVTLKNWAAQTDGTLPLENAWLGSTKP